jgi:hypothetical protein
MSDQDPNGRFAVRHIGVVVRAVIANKPRWFAMVAGRTVGKSEGYSTRKAAKQVANSHALAMSSPRSIPVGFDVFDAS